ncbi:hypothetical protein JX266_005953 [Neoarthrinium moseri]|nr:hypothetical protein JX266_005953 [Neoarthrinium moseri]
MTPPCITSSLVSVQAKVEAQRQGQHHLHSHQVNESAPGVRCSTCASRGREQWVLPGRPCPICGTPAM